jgi:hypothetical protein
MAPRGADHLMEEPVMFDPVFESMRKATETTIQMQQDLFKKWVSLYPGAGMPPFPWGEQAQKFHKKWAEIVTESMARQREVLEAQYNAGMKNLEAAFAVASAKDPEELKAKTRELWQKSFDCLRQSFEAQAKEFQASAAKWTEFLTKGAAARWRRRWSGTRPTPGSVPGPLTRPPPASGWSASASPRRASPATPWRSSSTSRPTAW